MCGVIQFLYCVFELFLFAYVTVGGTSSTSTSSRIVLDEVLEEAPKWKVLRVSE